MQLAIFIGLQLLCLLQHRRLRPSHRLPGRHRITTMRPSQYLPHRGESAIQSAIHQPIYRAQSQFPQR